MLAVIQLVTEANVMVEDKIIAQINQGIVALIGIEKTDDEKSAAKLLSRIINYRIFADMDGKMNLSLAAINGALLLVPQFTLVAETTKGTRPGFSIGMPPQEGESLFTKMISIAQNMHEKVQVGKFGADMLVSLKNDGPVTFILQSK